MAAPARVDVDASSSRRVECCSFGTRTRCLLCEQIERCALASKDARPRDSSGDIQAVSRVCQVLALLARQPAITPADVVAAVGLQRTTAHRYLTSLVREGFMARAAGGGYVAGPALLQVGVATVGSSPTDDAAPYMQRLAQDVRQTVVLSLWGGDRPIVSRVVEDESRLVHISVRVGSSLPLDAAQTQVFLAYLSNRNDVDRLLARLPLPTRRDLEAAIERTLANGFAVNSRVVDGVRVVAAPVFGRDGTIEATVGIVGTTSGVPDHQGAAIVQALLDTAGQISTRRGYQPSRPAVHVAESG